MTTVLLVHVAVTWAMVGVIWTIQLLQYPAMAAVPAEGFVRFEQIHQRRVTAVLALFAPVELATALWLFLGPGAIPRWMPLVGGLALVALWTSTGLFYAPLHGRLAAGFDPGLHRRLVRWNWARTAGWTGRGVLVLSMLTRVG
jgi:hypothetical protein